MDSLAPFHLTLSSPVTHIHHCVNAFLAFIFSIESAEARLHYIHMYVSSLRQEVCRRKADTEETRLQKFMIIDGIKALGAIAKTIYQDTEPRSTQFAGLTRLGFSYSNISKRFERSLCSYHQESSLNPLMGKAKMDHREGHYAMEELRAPSFYTRNTQSQIPPPKMNRDLSQFPEVLNNVSSGSSTLLSPLETYTQAKPVNININLVATVGTNINYINSAQDAMSGNYAQSTNQPRPQQNINRPQRISWNKELQAKFRNAVRMLGGPKLATAKRIWRLMDDETLTLRQVNSYLQRYRKKEKDIAESLKLGLP